ncbi:MAG: antirestriction protein ArdA [Prolixibacteraceae bacterium]
MTNLKIYCGTYYKYNCGSIDGAWLDLEDYSDFEELIEAMKELHKDEEDPEFMFQDYECPKLIEEMGLISECHISSEIYEIIEAIDNCSYDFEIIEAYSDCIGCSSEDIESIINKVEESYNGEFDSDEDFAEQLLTDCGEIPENLPSYIYIDWERTARDIMYDYSSSNNHYFRNI